MPVIMVLPVKSSPWVKIIMTRAMGKTRPKNILTRPGAFWLNHGMEAIMSDAPPPNATKHPDDMAAKNVLSIRDLPLFAPDRESISMVSAGEYGAKIGFGMVAL